jgi:hypothetical protein
MYTREMVSAGSTMTFSPLPVVRTKSFVRLYCSATKGEIFALNRPVPTTNTSVPSRKSNTTRCRTESHDQEGNNKCRDGVVLMLNNTTDSSASCRVHYLPKKTYPGTPGLIRQSDTSCIIYSARTGHNQNNMANESNHDCHTGGIISAPVGISDVRP